MTVSAKTMFASAIVVATTFAASAAWAQSKSDRAINQYTCKEVMHESGSNREVSIAFIHGYLLGKSGAAKFNIDDLLKQTDIFIDHCLDNPTEQAIDVMMKVKK
jgi:acid phosphatase class B